MTYQNPQGGKGNGAIYWNVLGHSQSAAVGEGGIGTTDTQTRVDFAREFQAHY